MENYKIRKLEDDIVALINASDVPIEAKRLILADIQTMIEKKSTQIIAAEIKTEVEQNGLCKDNMAELTQH